jgi:hypothetical protein
MHFRALLTIGCAYVTNKPTHVAMMVAVDSFIANTMNHYFTPVLTEAASPTPPAAASKVSEGLAYAVSKASTPPPSAASNETDMPPPAPKKM